MDAPETAGANPKVNGKGMRATAMRLVSEIGRSSVEERRSASLGNDLRLESERFVGTGLEFGDHIIQFRERKWFKSLGQDEESFSQEGIPKQMNNSSC